MNCEALLNLLPDTQLVYLVYEYFTVTGEADALRCVLSEDVYKSIVTDVAAEGNTLKVWVKENANANL